MFDHLFLIFDHPLLIFVVTFTLLWGGSWVGGRLRSRSTGLPETVREDYSLIVGATLTLLGLIIGFTFSMATTRYDLRKSLEEEEANAIGTEYARLDLLEPADAARLRPLLRQYTALRIEFYKAEERRRLREVGAQTTAMQGRLWSMVATAVKARQSPVAALAASGMNEVLNSQGYTQAAWWNRIPAAAWALMYFIAVLSNLLLGYGARGRALVLSFILPLIVSISFLLVADIDSPRGGIIRIHPQNLLALSDSFGTQ